jgi:protein phosphatase
MLTSVVGAQDDVDVTVTTHQVSARERLVLCTDGVHGSLSDARIAEIVRQAASPGGAAEALVREALSADGADNLTAIVAELGS